MFFYLLWPWFGTDNNDDGRFLRPRTWRPIIKHWPNLSTYPIPSNRRRSLSFQRNKDLTSLVRKLCCNVLRNLPTTSFRWDCTISDFNRIFILAVNLKPDHSIHCQGRTTATILVRDTPRGLVGRGFVYIVCTISHKPGYLTRNRDMFECPMQRTNTWKNSPNYCGVRLFEQTARRNHGDCGSDKPFIHFC